MIDSAIVDEIVDRADGVPLFVEKLTKAILEVGSAEASRAFGVLGAPTTVPPTLFTLLRRSRQELHARIADAPCERQFPDTLESRPELSATPGPRTSPILPGPTQC
jgi:hypothetical protein